MTTLAAAPPYLAAPRQPYVAARPSEQRQALAAEQHQRLMILLLVFAALVMAVMLRLVWLGASLDGERRTAALGGTPRGDIVDRRGEPLARTIDAWTIGVHPRKIIGDADAIAARLADLMPEKGDAAYFRDLITRPKSFLYLNRRASPALVEAVNAIGEPGIVFERETQRLYPEGTLAAHVLGFIAGGRGLSGIERSQNDALTGAVTAGRPVELAIDARAQAALEDELGGAMTSFAAKGGAGVILDVATGEVVAMASMPLFNPNRVGMAGTEVLRNNVTQSVYELGSTFKPITMAAAIDTGIVTSMARRFDATAPLAVGPYRIRDDHPQNRWLNIPETLVHSSNIVTARVADLVGAGRMQAMFRKLGFDQKADIELREKAHPLWPKYWARSTVMTTGYGHGMAVTPLHLATAYAALVNGGVWRPATLMKVAPGKAAPGRRVISAATSFRMRQLLRLVVLDGTGRKGDAPGYRVGGKTGTAEVAEGGGYNKHSNVVTFAAAFPMDAPRYVVVAMLDTPKGNEASHGLTTAAWTVAPVVSRTISRTGAMLGVLPDETRDIDTRDLSGLLWHAPGESGADPE